MESKLFTPVTFGPLTLRNRTKSGKIPVPFLRGTNG